MIPLATDKCGRFLTYQHFIECGETWKHTRVNNVPKQPETYTAIRDLCEHVLDRVWDRFGPIVLTYAFASYALYKEIRKPKGTPLVSLSGDQHAGCELNRNGKPYCHRLGQGVDFKVPCIGSRKVADWIIDDGQYDRLYFYTDDRPFHVSYGPEHSKFTRVYAKAPH